MSEDDRRDIFQRLQVGIVGLVAVLVFVSITNFIVGSAAEEQAGTTADTNSQEAADTAETESETPKEPLAELGVAPSPDSEGQATEAPQTAPIGEAEQIVPDLEPDPKLDKPMDRGR